MSNTNGKSKSIKRARSSIEKLEWDKALMTLRKLRKSAQQGESRARVVVTNDAVIVQADKVERAKGRYKQPANAVQKALNQQVRLHAEYSREDRQRIIRTLKESPSDDAMTFYQTLSTL